jgi:hypothetical protein
VVDLWVWVEDLSLDWGLIVAVDLCWIVGMGCRSGFEWICVVDRWCCGFVVAMNFV